MINGTTKFRVRVEKMWRGYWSFGICLSHNDDETYIFINIFKWNVAIGKLYEDGFFGTDEWEEGESDDR